MNWIGYEEDKEEFFDRIINCYLGHIPHEKIWIVEGEEEPSLFDTSGIALWEPTNKKNFYLHGNEMICPLLI